MSRYIARRVLMMAPSLVGLTIAVFLLMRLIPGDVIDILLGDEFSLAPEVRENLRRTLGLDTPFYVQYVNWVADAVRGDLGRSFRTGQPVLQMILQRLPVTAELALLSLTLAMCMSIPLGVVSAVHRNGWIDLFARTFSLVGLSVPNFWLAAMLILVASLYFNWLPPVVYARFTDSPLENLSQMALPAITLSTSSMGSITRMTRSAMLEVLGQDYVRTSRAKGLGERVVIYRHALKNALIPIMTIIGIQMGGLLGGAVIIEQIFGLPGIGLLVLNGIYQRDYSVVQGGVLFIASTFLVLNLVVDVLYAYVNPQIRYG